jgi:hypothetical protein
MVRDTETNGAQGGTNDKENCVEVIYEFCENKLKIENAKMKMKIQKAQRLGKTKVASPVGIVDLFRNSYPLVDFKLFGPFPDH